MESYTNLTGLFQVQQSILNDISLNNNGDISQNILNNISSSLNNYFTSFQNAYGSGSNIFSDLSKNTYGVYNSANNLVVNASNKYNQATQLKMDTNRVYNNLNELQNGNIQDVSGIIKNELERLNTKKVNIDNALTSQHRIAALNESYRLRYMQYIYIIVIIVIVLVLICILMILKKNQSIIPDIIFDILVFLIGIITIFIVYFQYINIQSRSRLNYNELYLPSNNKATPSPAELAEQQALAKKQGNLLGSINLNYPIGIQSCSGGLQWDSNRQVCYGTSNFTTMDLAYNNTQIGGSINGYKTFQTTDYQPFK
jgi:hypothetical protein